MSDDSDFNGLAHPHTTPPEQKPADPGVIWLKDEGTPDPDELQPQDTVWVRPPAEPPPEPGAWLSPGWETPFYEFIIQLAETCAQLDRAAGHLDTPAIRLFSHWNPR